MHVISGKGVSTGKATGRFHYIKSNEYIVEKEHCKKSDHELFKYQIARGEALDQLQSIYEKALHKVGENDAKIFSIQQMIIYEEEFNKSVHRKILDENVTASYAVYTLALEYMDMLAAIDDEYMSARQGDIRDVSQRIIRNIYRKSHQLFNYKLLGSGLVIYKDYLTPSEIIEIDMNNISAATTSVDSYFSHSCILARTMKLPGITGITEDVYKYDGKIVTVDGDTGEISFKLS